MQKFSLKALGAVILTLGLVVAGVAPAQAATGYLTPTTTFTAGAGNASGLTFSTGNISASPVQSLTFKIYNTGTQWMSFSPAASGCNTFVACKITQVKVGSTTFNSEGASGNYSVSVLGTQGVANQSQSSITFTFSGTQGMPILNNEALEVVFGAGALTAPNTNGNYTVSGTLSSSSMTEYTTTATVSGASSTVTFNANGGTGTMASQVANTSTALTLNSFTKSGYTFGGWATSQVNADAGTVAYADGATYDFATSRTLRAVWIPAGQGGGSSSGGSSSSSTLATTGFDAAPYLFGGLALALTGGVLMLIARRKQIS